jgi:hypothetical protein
VKATVESQHVRDNPIDGSPEPAPLAPPPRGEFVSARFESDCARFVAEAKSLARHRVEAGFARPSAAQ